MSFYFGFKRKQHDQIKAKQKKVTRSEDPSVAQDLNVERKAEKKKSKLTVASQKIAEDMKNSCSKDRRGKRCHDHTNPVTTAIGC